MTIKRIYFSSMLHEQGGQNSAFSYALDLAAIHRAHLTISIGVPIIIIPMDYPSAAIADIQLAEDARRLGLAKDQVEELRVKANIAGINASVDVCQNINPMIYDHFCDLARVHDISIVSANTDAEFQWDATVALLAKSGGPVLVVPKGWQKGATIHRVILAWDASAQASRAARDAVPILKPSTEIEVLIVTGETKTARKALWGDIATHLAARFSNVTTNEIPAQDGNVGRAINNHASLNRFDLVIMGGYGHSRFREWVFGGVTRELLKTTDIPLLLSH